NMRRYTTSPTTSIHNSHPHRDLHSFPTRRSSDLARSLLSIALNMSRPPATAPAAGPGYTLGVFDANILEERIMRLLNKSPRISRSEEHTSELQSRGHLVCRLLLEKKKPQIQHTMT